MDLEQFCTTCLSRLVACLSNAVSPAWSPRWNQTGNTESVCLWERGLQSSISEKRSLGTALPSYSMSRTQTVGYKTITRSRLHKLRSLRKGLFLASSVLSSVCKTNYSHGICSALYAPIKRSAQTRPAVLKHRASTHTLSLTHTLKKKENRFLQPRCLGDVIRARWRRATAGENVRSASSTPPVRG